MLTSLVRSSFSVSRIQPLFSNHLRALASVPLETGPPWFDIMALSSDRAKGARGELAGSSRTELFPAVSLVLSLLMVDDRLWFMHQQTLIFGHNKS